MLVSKTEGEVPLCLWCARINTSRCQVSGRQAQCPGHVIREKESRREGGGKETIRTTTEVSRDSAAVRGQDQAAKKRKKEGKVLNWPRKAPL